MLLTYSKPNISLSFVLVKSFTLSMLIKEVWASHQGQRINSVIAKIPQLGTKAIRHRIMLSNRRTQSAN